MDRQLALNGGRPVRERPWPKWPVFTEKERTDLVAVLDDGRMTAITGPTVREFEEKFADRFGAGYALATSNGVTALHLALGALGVGPGDEVIVPAHTFIGTAIPVLMANAVPVFVDIDGNTFNMDPARIEAAITDRTKAIIPVHLNGLPAEMDEIRRIVGEHGLFIVEDACQAHGAAYRGRLAGTMGDIGCFSFFEDKVMTTGEGGMLITDDEELYDRARCMRSYGEELVDKVGERRYEHVTLGFNYRLGALNASIGINQLDRLEDMVALRNRNAAFLHERLADLVAITPPRVVDYCRHAYYKYVCRINRNEIKTDLMTFVEAVRAEGIPVTPRYPRPLPLQKVFREKGGYGTTDCPYGCDKYGREPSFLKGSWPEAERVGEEAFVVQVHPTIGEEDYDDVIRAFQKVAAHFEKS